MFGTRTAGASLELTLSFLATFAVVGCGSPEGPPVAVPPVVQPAQADAGHPAEMLDAGVLSPQELARIATAQGWLDQVVDYEYAPGVAVAIVRPDGEHFIHAGTLGSSSTAPVNEHTVFEVGSVSKTFTATTLALLVGDGAVTLSTPAETLLPKGATMPSGTNGEQITLRHLATHYSGLPREGATLLKDDLQKPYGDATEADLFAVVSSTTLNRNPGAGFEYSNLAVGLLGHLTARAAQRSSFEELLYERVLIPLEMNRTFVTPTGAPNVAIGHSEEEPVPALQFSVLHGAGAVTSTTSDMTRYLRAQLHAMSGRDELLPPGMGEAMRLTHARHADLPGSGMSLGLNWFRGWPDSVQLPNAQNIVQHGGVTFGFRAMSLVSADDDLAVVVLANTNSMPDEALAANLLRLWRGEQPTFALRPSLDVPTATLDRYVGVFQMQNGFQLTVTRQADRLYIAGTGQPSLRAYAHAEHTFHSRVVEATFVFSEGAGGAIDTLTLHQDGGQYVATRVN